MKILVIGSGGREHAIVQKVKQSRHVTHIDVIPGNDAMIKEATIHPTIAESNHQAIVEFAQQHRIDWVIIGPEQPLIDGLADSLIDADIDVFGPKQAAAQIEGSKSFAKQLMEKYQIPTAAYREIETKTEALQYIQTCELPVVLKKDGLAAGKGVIIAKTRQQAKEAVEKLYPNEREKVVFEAFLEGEEFSVMTFVNGNYAVPFETIAQDHKRAFDHDKGPNTGGMGAYCPVPHISDDVLKQVNDQIAQPIAHALATEGFHYFGILYIGAILTEEGPKVIEFNARLGDPEAQVLLRRLDSDFMEHILELKEKQPISQKWKSESIVGVMMASQGYPGTYQKGHIVTGFEDALEHYIVSGLKRDGDVFKTIGGRVILAIGEGETIKDAQAAAYQHVHKIKSNGLFYRKDIASKAFLK